MHFTPFAVSADGLYGKEADALMKRLAKLLADKWQRPYSQVCGWIKSRLAIAICRAVHLCLYGSRVTEHRRPIFEDGAGLTLCEW